MNILPMPDGAQARVHYHKGIETIAYLREGECVVYYGDALERQATVRAGEQIFVPADVPHAPCNRSGAPCTWIVVHSSGSDQDGIVLLPELDDLLSSRQAIVQLHPVALDLQHDRLGSFAVQPFSAWTDQYPLLLQQRTNAGAVGLSAKQLYPAISISGTFGGSASTANGHNLGQVFTLKGMTYGTSSTTGRSPTMCVCRTRSCSNCWSTIRAPF